MQMKHIMKIKKDNKKVYYDVQVSSGFIVIFQNTMHQRIRLPFLIACSLIGHANGIKVRSF